LPETLDIKFVLIICVLAKFLKHRKNQNIASDIAIDAKRLFELSLENNPPPPACGMMRGLVVLAVRLCSRCAACPISRVS
jgi:hypothetical protein